ncbi:hypothetical protein BDN71DRAFT_1432106 [Pleurotus eryngii]|uniref:Uncharacterized protein n=1 Tax=Pleurotus eryngii TaxID=5323 RepID=A0A9P6D7E9_PLEER|nr:hypothetical protein BDN71DRAFT_1432106 [Pleurotus eryngii]
MSSEFTMIESTKPTSQTSASYVVYWSGGDGDIIRQVCVIVARLWKPMGEKGGSILMGSGPRSIKTTTVQVERVSLIILSVDAASDWIKDATKDTKENKQFWVTLANCKAHPQADTRDLDLDLREVETMPHLTTFTVA